MTREATCSTKVPLPAPQKTSIRMEGELDPARGRQQVRKSDLRNSMKLEGAESPHLRPASSSAWVDDGHTASLFPHTEGLNELGRHRHRQPRPAKRHLARHAHLARHQPGQPKSSSKSPAADKAERLSRSPHRPLRPRAPALHRLIRPATGKLTLPARRSRRRQAPCRSRNLHHA